MRTEASHLTQLYEVERRGHSDLLPSVVVVECGGGGGNVRWALRDKLVPGQ